MNQTLGIQPLKAAVIKRRTRPTTRNNEGTEKKKIAEKNQRIFDSRHARSRRLLWFTYYPSAMVGPCLPSAQ